ncbi:MAG: hypothetical protein ACYS9X_24295 [Planctomycetota bacterium]
MRHALFLALVAGAVGSGVWTAEDPYGVAEPWRLIIPFVLLPIAVYLCVDSIRRLGEPAPAALSVRPRAEPGVPAASRLRMIPWSAACALVLVAGFYLLLTNPDNAVGFVFGSVFATTSFYSAFLSEHFSRHLTAPVAFCVVEWVAIWAAGMLSLWRRKRVPWTGLLAAHFALGFWSYAFLGLRAALRGGPGPSPSRTDVVRIVVIALPWLAVGVAAFVRWNRGRRILHLVQAAAGAGVAVAYVTQAVVVRPIVSQALSRGTALGPIEAWGLVAMGSASVVPMVAFASALFVSARRALAADAEIPAKDI